LGVGDLLLKNGALLFKWWWRYACEEGAMWRVVVNSIHNEDFAILLAQTLPSILGPWKEIKRLSTEASSIQESFFQNIKVKLGEGSKIRFWKDPWAMHKPLQVYSTPIPVCILFPLSNKKVFPIWDGLREVLGDGL